MGLSATYLQRYTKSAMQVCVIFLVPARSFGPKPPTVQLLWCPEYTETIYTPLTGTKIGHDRCCAKPSGDKFRSHARWIFGAIERIATVENQPPAFGGRWSSAPTAVVVW